MTRRPTGPTRRTPSFLPVRPPARAVAPGPGGSLAAPARRVAAAAAAWTVALLGAVAGVAAPAAGHDALSGSTPADGTTVEAPPSSVDLSFSEPPLGIGAEVRVTGPDGQVVNAGDLVITDTTVSQPIAGDLPAGAYAVAWRVTSSDGHPISGELSFTAAAGTAPAPAPAPTDEPTEEPTEEPTDGATTGPTDAATELPTADPPGSDVAAPGETDDAGGAGALPWVLGGTVLLAAAGAAWWAARRRAAGV